MNKGIITQVIGAVVDVKFEGELPEILTALECKNGDKNKKKYIKKKNVYYRPWGRYTNLFEGKEFLIKELYVKPKGILSLQKHHHRAEHWLVTQGNAKITLNKDIIVKKPGEHIFIPLEAIHRVQNPGKKPVKIIDRKSVV